MADSLFGGLSLARKVHGGCVLLTGVTQTNR